jgi:hypothetical protein
MCPASLAPPANSLPSSQVSRPTLQLSMHPASSLVPLVTWRVKITLLQGPVCREAPVYSAPLPPPLPPCGCVSRQGHVDTSARSNSWALDFTDQQLKPTYKLHADGHNATLHTFLFTSHPSNRQEDPLSHYSICTKV